MNAGLWVSLARGWQVPSVLVGWGVLLGANLIGPRVVVLPSVGSSGQIPTPFVFLLGGLLGVLAVLLAAEPCPAVFLTAPSRARLVNAARVGLASLLGPFVLTVIGPGDWAAATSTTIAVTGEGLIAASVLGLRLAWLPPLLHLVAAASFGAATRDTLRPWAWIISAEPSTSALMASTALWALGLGTWMLSMGHRSEGLEI